VESSARQNYLETEVMTATPQKLQLMMIDAAIRSAEIARQKWHADLNDEACEALIHAQEVVGEMLAGLNPEVDETLAKKVAAVYLFVFRTLMEALHEHDEKKLADAIEVLKVERETWHRVCEKLGSTRKPGEESVAASPSVIQDTATAGPPIAHLPDLGSTTDSTTSGLSLEA